MNNTRLHTKKRKDFSMSGANIFASIVIGFCGGSLVRVFTGPVIEVPNFTQKQPSPQRLVFMPKKINGETQYVLSRVEDARTPYLNPEQIVDAYNKFDQQKN